MNQKLALIISSSIILSMLAVSLWAWGNIPDQPIPVHFDMEGRPDSYGSKFEGLLLTPAVAIAFNFLLVLLPKIEPRKEHLLSSSKAYGAVWIANVACLAVLHGTYVAIILGQSAELYLTPVQIAVGILLMVMGNYTAKIQSNFSFGFRTPWTLSSEQSWNKSHRLGGWLMFVLGLGCIAVSFTESSTLFWWVLLGGSGVITLAIGVYSYLIWKDDPKKRSLSIIR
jgi:uncharacterized membrane protein